MTSPPGVGVLVKAPKPGQDRRFDLPSIGPRTIENVARAGLPASRSPPAARSSPKRTQVDRRGRPRKDFPRRRARGRGSDEARAQPPQSRGRCRSIIVAAEESGDALGAALAQALRGAQGGAVKLAGVGGRAMAAAGIASPFAIDELAIIGLTAIPRRLPTILRRIRETADAIVAARPDALVIIDSPDFTHRVARRVRRRAPSIPILDYVSPSVWAWRPGRARAMRAYVDQVLAILPFEPAVHARLGGPPCTYVGHPLIERIAELRPNADEARRRLADPPLVLVLPGSRSNEIRRLARHFRRRDRTRRIRASAPMERCAADRSACRLATSAKPLPAGR